MIWVDLKDCEDSEYFLGVELKNMNETSLSIGLLRSIALVC